eukprot:gene22073-28168_t
MLHGRKIKLETGVKKERTSKKDTQSAVEATEEQESEEKPPAPVVTKVHTKDTKVTKSVESVTAAAVGESEPAVEAASEASIKKSRQILVFGIPVDINKKAFKMSVSKISRKADVELIKEENELSESLYIINPPGKIMMVTATSRAEAAKILKALNNATVHSLEIRKHMPADKTLSAAEIEAAALAAKSKKEKLVARTLADMTEVEYRKRKCRVILRNLSFQAIEQNVIDRMSKFGPLVSVEIPRTIIEKVNANRRKATKTPKNEEEEEENAEGGEGESPDQRTDNQVLRPKGFGFVTFLCEKDAKAAVEDSAGLRVCNREVAIDFCMNKESYTKYGIKTAEEEAADEVAQATGEEDETGSKEDNEEEEEEEGEGGEEGEEDSDGEGEADESSSAEKADKDKPADDVQEGCTVFVRGLPFDAEVADLKSAMRPFGRILMAIVVKDKLTGISKGSAFVKFSNQDEVAACLAEANENSGLTIKDRVCKVNVAVDRESAQKLKTEDRGGKDKRNLYLANEGLVVQKEGAKEAKKTGEMSEADKEKRQRAQNEKRKKLQNPLFFVSGNRLSIRNLGKDVTDNELRISCLKAVKAALTKGLVTREDLELHMKAQGSATAVTLDIPPMATKTCVKSAKVMLDLTRVRSGIPQSKGYGFVEFSHHAHALACLRELNNSAKYSDIATTGAVNGGVEATGGKGRLIVEFSLENIQKVKVLREREVRQKQYLANTAAATVPVVSKAAQAKEDKAAKRKAEKRERREKSKEEETDKVEEVKPAAVDSEASTKKSGKKRKSDAVEEKAPVESESVSVKQQEKKAPKQQKKQEKEQIKDETTVNETKKVTVAPVTAKPVSAPVASSKPDSKKQKKESAVTAPVVTAPSVVVSSTPVTTAKVVSTDAPSAATVAKADRKLKKGELQKKRKMEHKAAKREAAAAVAASSSGANDDSGAPATKKSRVETPKTVPTSTAVSEKKVASSNKPPAAAKGEKKKAAEGEESEEVKQRPWGGHKRLRNDKKKTTASKAGANKKK